MTCRPDHLAGQTYHGRHGAVDNAFRYRVDYLLLDPEAAQEGPRLFARNARALMSLHDSDHGGAPKQGSGAHWARQVLERHGLAEPCKGRLLLLAQPRVLGHVFNPVSFWLAHDADGALTAVIAEVSNTFGDRHSYLCHKDGAPITRSDTLRATKIFHVSPFQPVEGGYSFRFDIRPDRVGIWIDYRQSEEDEGKDGGGIYATLTGRLAPLTDRAILSMCLRRPFGSRRVLALIHWQALKLWWKGALYRRRPSPPDHEVSG